MIPLWNIMTISPTGHPMKTLIAITLLIAASAASAQIHVRGYTKKDGTYVAPHERTAPNNTNLDNYSTRGNVNPYTGQPGTKEPDSYGYGSARPAPSLQPIQPSQPLQPLQPIQPPSNPYALPQAPTNRF